MGPAFERAAARAGWLLTNDPDGNLILAAIDDPGPGETTLADDSEAAAVFRRALRAGEPYARAALRDLLATGPSDYYVIDILGGYTAAQAYLRMFSTHRVLGTEPEAASGRLAMIADRPLHGFACRLVTNTTATASQVLLDHDSHTWIAANHDNHAWVIRWTEAADALRAERDRRRQLGLTADLNEQELLVSWLRHEPSTLLVPVASLDTTVTAAAIVAALDRAGINTSDLAIHPTSGHQAATIALPGVTIGAGRYDPQRPNLSRFDFDSLHVRPTGHPSQPSCPVASLDELTSTVATVQILGLTGTTSRPTAAIIAPARSPDPAASNTGGLPADPLTRDELLARIHASGRDLSDRNLVYYTSEGLLPPAARTGRGPGRYPEHVYELACWIIDSRATGLPLSAIRELVPLHRYLTAAPAGAISQDKVQALLDQITSPQAVREIPWLVTSRPLSWDTSTPTLTAGGRTWTPAQPPHGSQRAAHGRATLRRAAADDDLAITS